MDLGIHHFDAGGETVGEDATGFPFEDGHQTAAKVGIGIVEMQGAGQLALQAAGNLLHLGGVADADDQAEGTEDFLSQSVVRQPISAGDLVQVGGGIAQIAGGGQHGADTVPGRHPIAACAVGVGDAIGEHGLRTDRRDGGLGGLDESVGVLAVDHHGNAGVGAELARAEGERPGPALGDGFPAGGEGGRKEKHRVDRAKLAEEGNGFGPCGAEVEQRAAPGERAGEADGLDVGVLDKRFAHVALAALHQREGTGGHAAGADRGVDGLRDDLAGAGVGGVALDHDRASGGEGGGGVAPGGRESERKIRGAEDGNRADGPLDQLDVGARRGLAVRQRGVVAAIEPVVFQDMAGEEAQLHGGAAAFALQPGGGQAGFLGADLGDLGATRFDLVGDAVQEGGALGTGLGGIGGEGGFGGFAGDGDMGGSADGELVRQAMRRGRGEGLVACDPVACDQVVSGQHGRSFQKSKAAVVMRSPRVRASATWIIGARSTSELPLRTRSAIRA